MVVLGLRIRSEVFYVTRIASTKTEILGIAYAGAQDLRPGIILTVFVTGYCYERRVSGF